MPDTTKKLSCTMIGFLAHSLNNTTEQIIMPVAFLRSSISVKVSCAQRATVSDYRLQSQRSFPRWAGRRLQSENSNNNGRMI